MEHFIAESNTSSASNGRQQVAWPRIFLFIVVPLSVLLLVVILILNIVILQQKGSGSEQLNLDKRFPGYFRSPEELTLLEASLHRFTDVDEIVVSNVTCGLSCSPASNVTCDLTCSAASNVSKSGRVTIPFYPILMNDIHHACCISRSTYSPFPSWMVDIYGQKRTIATFNNARQVFLNETCKQVDNCSNCKCQKNNILVSAVYVSGSDYDVGTFEVPGCCKCVNRLT